jgi:spectinomycin phosphotransferase
VRQQPVLDDSAVIQLVNIGYGLEVADIAFLPLGADAASAVYRVQTHDARQYLLKARKSEWFSPASLLVPQRLAQRGVPSIVAPIAPITQELCVVQGGYAWSLFPYLQGRLAAEEGLTDAQWTRLGSVLRQVHELGRDDDIASTASRETFTPSRMDLIPKLAEVLHNRRDREDFHLELADFWRSKRSEIDRLIDCCQGLSRQLRQDPAPLVLCHADLHVWNILVENGGELWIVDWDETRMALKECDLMFVVGSIGRGLVSADETMSFMRGYGDVDLDPRALTYYRCAWALQDIAAYGEQVLFAPDLGSAARQAALQSFMGLFDPENIVSIALDPDTYPEGR